MVLALFGKSLLQSKNRSSLTEFLTDKLLITYLDVEVIRCSSSGKMLFFYSIYLYLCEQEHLELV